MQEVKDIWNLETSIRPPPSWLLNVGYFQPNNDQELLEIRHGKPLNSEQMLETLLDIDFEDTLTLEIL